MSGKIDPKLETIYFHLEMAPEHDETEIVADIHVHRPVLNSDSDAKAAVVCGIVCDTTRVQLWNLRGLPRDEDDDYYNTCRVSVKWTGNQVRLDVTAFGKHFFVVCEEGAGGELVVKDRSALTRDPRTNKANLKDIVKCVTQSSVDAKEVGCEYVSLKKVPNPCVEYHERTTDGTYVRRVREEDMIDEICGEKTFRLKGAEERKKLDRKGF